MQAYAFVGEEPEEVVFNNWSADASSELAILFQVTLRARAGKKRECIRAADTGERFRPRSGCWTVEFVESVQARVLKQDYAASMQLIRSTFGNAFNHNAGITPVLRIVAGGYHRDFGYGFLTGSDYRCSAPVETVHAHAVDQIIIGIDTLAV